MKLFAQCIEGEPKEAFINYYRDEYSPHGGLIRINIGDHVFLFGFRHSAKVGWHRIYSHWRPSTVLAWDAWYREWYSLREVKDDARANQGLPPLTHADIPPAPV